MSWSAARSSGTAEEHICLWEAFKESNCLDVLIRQKKPAPYSTAPHQMRGNWINPLTPKHDCSSFCVPPPPPQPPSCLPSHPPYTPPQPSCLMVLSCMAAGRVSLSRLWPSLASRDNERPSVQTARNALDSVDWECGAPSCLCLYIIYCLCSFLAKWW